MQRKIVLNTSMENDTVMDGDPLVVRGHLYYGGWLLEEQIGGGTLVEYVVQVDPRGIIPNW
jgi:hypothetical protein